MKIQKKLAIAVFTFFLSSYERKVGLCILNHFCRIITDYCHQGGFFLRPDPGSLAFQAFERAMQEARAAYTAGEVPVGACIVAEDRIIVSEHNHTVRNADATAHAELRCIQKACMISKSERLPEMHLYVTLEPCLMCTGAIIQSRLASVSFLLPDPSGPAMTSILRESHGLNHNPSFACCEVKDLHYAEPLKGFFATRRIKTGRPHPGW